ncbi:uncharacterized protein [Argopecten irradians]|uniref:uncharacterized protein n=1 Tax=Argopecten irradians TaxID=31199 RepID=UPI00370F88D7
MSSKKSIAVPFKTLKIYKDVAGLKADDLKKLCIFHDIDVTFPKKAKVIFLCHALGISTTGSGEFNDKLLHILNNSINSFTPKQLAEYKQLTPKYLSTIKHWTNDLTLVPGIDETAVKKYLINSNVLDVSTARTYKLSRPYQLKQFVHSVKYYDNPDSETFSIVCARCNPSQSTNSDDVKVVFVFIDKLSGVPYGGFCTCTVGYSQTCSHIGATLFSISDLVASGQQQTSLLSCTDKLCQWSDPKGASSKPSTFDELPIYKKEKKIKRTSKDFGSKIANPDLPNYDDVLDLRVNLFTATHHLGQYCPAVHILNCNRFKQHNDTLPFVETVLADNLEEHSHSIAYSCEITVASTPIPIYDLCRRLSLEESNLDAIVSKITYSQSDRDKIELLTRGQSENLEWFEQRKGSITGSNFGKVLRVVEKNTLPCKSLITDCVGYKFPKVVKTPSVSSLQWGLTKESVAKADFLKKYTCHHHNLDIKECGLQIHEKHPFIRASPDGIITCNCHQPSLIEIKCPYKSRNLTVADAVGQKLINYLSYDKEINTFTLNTSDIYYAQVQGLMAILGLASCNFVVWTTCDLVNITIMFDEPFWKNRLYPACNIFFKKHILPEILSGSLSKNISTKSITDLTPSQNPIDNHATTCTGSSSQKPIDNHVTICTGSYKCGECQRPLPETNFSPDNSDASVGCDCSNCGCDVWYCWPCARYDNEQSEENMDWYCPKCTRECDIVYS